MHHPSTVDYLSVLLMALQYPAPVWTIEIQLAKSAAE